MMIMKEPKVSDFINKLYDILQNPEYNSIITWSDEDIIIKDTDRLVNDILPMYYRHSKLESFVRQLNLYGFRKIPKPYNKQPLYFRNDYFKPGKRELLWQIQLKNKEKKEESKNASRTMRGEEVEQLTKKRMQELDQTAKAFRKTVQEIYSRIREYVNPNLSSLLKESITMLKLSGARDDNLPMYLRTDAAVGTVTHFLTNCNIALQ